MSESDFRVFRDKGGPMSTDTTIRAMQAESGRWHLVGEHGCFSANMEQARLNNTKRLGSDPRRTLNTDTEQWCFYCAKDLELIQLERENERLRERLDAADGGQL